MPELQEAPKPVEIDPAAVRRALETIQRISGVVTSSSGDTDEGAVTIRLSSGNKKGDSGRSKNGAGAARGRGARKRESREELLARLLDPVLTLDETARVLEVCPTTVRRYTNKGILQHERSKGNQRRFKLSSVLTFMEEQSQAANRPRE